MLDKQNVLKLGKIVDPFDEVLSKYFDVVACEGLGHDAVRNNKSTLKFCYTPMHGVGYYFIEEGFKRAMLPVVDSITVRITLNFIFCVCCSR